MIVVTNYHSFFWWQVRMHQRALGLPEQVRLSSWSRRKELLGGADAEAARLGRDEDWFQRFAEQAHPQIAPQNPLSEETTATLLRVVREDQTRGCLTFDDFGTLFWDLITRFPSVRRGLRERYPVVIADEHQDASTIQDALVRELGGERRVILGDQMQLIHAFRGADEARLDAHRAECDRAFELATPHRWHDAPQVGAWLLAVRHRLRGVADAAPAPREARVKRTNPAHGDGPMLAHAKYAVRDAFRGGCRSVAVLSRWGDDVDTVRDYLAKAGLHPRQLGSSDLVENGLALIESLPTLAQRDVVDRAIDTVFRFIPGLSSDLRRQVAESLRARGSVKDRCSPQARVILDAMDEVYFDGSSKYFASVVRASETFRSRGLDLPRRDEFALYQLVAASPGLAVEEQFAFFGERLGALSHRCHQLERGLLTMTVHQAKGREFDAVILYGANRRHFSDDPDSRRIFYVALTRGIKRWIVIATEGQESPLVGALGL